MHFPEILGNYRIFRIDVQKEMKGYLKTIYQQNNLMFYI